MSTSHYRLPTTTPRSVEAVYSATGDRFPVLPPSGHPARRLFLDSSSSLSATRFFGALMGGGQQMNSPARGPRPWRSRNRLERGPSEQGARSYRPFRRESSSSSSSNNNNNNNNTATEGGGGEIQRTELRRLQQLRSGITATGILPGRPRPFYSSRVRRRSRRSGDEFEPVSSSLTLRSPKSLEHTVRSFLLREFGLSLLPVVLSPLPPLARRRLLTFHCEEFEEAPESAISGGAMRYVVRSVDERGKKEAKEYLAIFAANEGNKLSGSLWDELRPWLQPPSYSAEGVLPILALAVDPETENVFFVTSRSQRDCLPTSAAEEAERLLEKLSENVQSDRVGEILSQSACRSLFFVAGERVLCRNPVLISSLRDRLKEFSAEEAEELLGILGEAAERLSTKFSPS